MPHYRLLKAVSADSREILEVDSQSAEAALLDFGRQLGTTLSFSGAAAPDYIMQSRMKGEVNFTNSKNIDVFLRRP